jgi:hypothetical protein
MFVLLAVQLLNILINALLVWFGSNQMLDTAKRVLGGMSSGFIKENMADTANAVAIPDVATGYIQQAQKGRTGAEVGGASIDGFTSQDTLLNAL